MMQLSRVHEFRPREIARSLLLLIAFIWITGGYQCEAQAQVDTGNKTNTSPWQGMIFDDRVLAANVDDVRQHAAVLDDRARLRYLADFVLPRSARRRIRMSAQFMPTNVAPNGFDSQPADGELVSPVFDLLQHAKRLGQLGDIDARVRRASPEGELQIRARLAMLTLLSFEMGESDAAETALSELIAMVKLSQPSCLEDMWPETLAAYYGVHHFPKNGEVQTLIDILYETRAYQRKPAGMDAWHTHIQSLYARSMHFRQGGKQPTFNGPIDSADWLASARTSDRTRGLGRAEERWYRTSQDELRHAGGHESDYLLYRTPLQGNFEVHAELGHGSTQVLLAGTVIGASSSGDLFKGTFRTGVQPVKIEPPIRRPGDLASMRAVFS